MYFLKAVFHKSYFRPTVKSKGGSVSGKLYNTFFPFLEGFILLESPDQFR
jgi:hypothetical protein